MSTTIYESSGAFFVARLASTCERCRQRGACVQFGFVCSDEGEGAHTHNLCFNCLNLLHVACCNDEPLDA